MVYYAGKTSSWEPRDHTEPSRRRVRYNSVTGFHEVIGGGTPPVAYPTQEAAAASMAQLRTGRMMAEGRAGSW